MKILILLMGFCWQMAAWGSVQQPSGTAADNVHLDSITTEIPSGYRTRRLWIYLPPDYDTSGKRYPVLYMQDGQNVFDERTSFAGEWKADETLNRLFANGNEGVIVVAIENAGEQRIDEYAPWRNTKYGGGRGNEYAQFMADELKPYIDGKYRTMTSRESTGLMGSSMGGLITFYSGLEYQHIFGKLGVFSPSFWFSDSLWSWLDTITIKSAPRIYFLAGSEEGREVIGPMEEVYIHLIDKGIPKDQMHFCVMGGRHNELFWSKKFEEAYRFLFLSEPPSRSFQLSDPLNFQLSPNLPGDSVRIKIPKDTVLNCQIQVFDAEGALVLTRKISESQTLDLKTLRRGIYWLWVKADGNMGMEMFVKK